MRSGSALSHHMVIRAAPCGAPAEQAPGPNHAPANHMLFTYTCYTQSRDCQRRTPAECGYTMASTGMPPSLHTHQAQGRTRPAPGHSKPSKQLVYSQHIRPRDCTHTNTQHSAHTKLGTTHIKRLLAAEYSAKDGTKPLQIANCTPTQPYTCWSHTVQHTTGRLETVENPSHDRATLTTRLSPQANKRQTTTLLATTHTSCTTTTTLHPCTAMQLAHPNRPLSIKLLPD